MADNTNVSLSDVIKKNQRLKKHAKAATNAVGNRDYAGPAGDVVCKFDTLRMIVKDGATYAILRFVVDGSIDGQEEHNGSQCSIIHSLSDSDRATAEQGLDRLMMDIQRMGLTTSDREISDIEKELLAKKNSMFIISAVPGKSGNGRMYFMIRSVYKTQGEWTEEESEYNNETAEVENEENEVEDLDTPESEDAVEEVEDALPESVSTQHDDYEPSAWIGYEVGWTNPKTKKELTYTVVDADDTAKTVVLELDGKRVRVKYTDLNLVPF